MQLLVFFLILILPLSSFAQFTPPNSHQTWQSATVVDDVLTIGCAALLLPFELGRVLSEPSASTQRGEMDESLRSAHPTKVKLQPQTGTSDQITSISGCAIDGAIVQLATTDVGDSITIVHTPGVIDIGSSVVLNSPTQVLTLQRKVGTWVLNSGVGGAGGGGALENLTTACTTGQVGVSDGAGNVDCGRAIFYLADCSTRTAVGDICVDSDDGLMYAGDGTAVVRVNVYRVAADCAVYANIGDLCIDTDDGTVWAGDGAEVYVLGSTSGGSETLDQAFDLGKVIDGANSEANALVVGNGTDGFKIFVGTGGPTIKCFVGSATCDIVADIPTGNAYRIKYNGTDGISIDSSGNVTLANNMLIYRSFWFGAGALSGDGTNCLNAEEAQINGGPKIWQITCADNAASVLYGNAGMPDGYNGGAITFELQATNLSATPSGNLNFDFSAMCRASGGSVNASWGSTVELNMAFTTQYGLVHSPTITVTPNGTCAGGDQIFWRAVMDSVSTTTQVSSTRIIGVKMEFPTSDWSDQ